MTQLTKKGRQKAKLAQMSPAERLDFDHTRALLMDRERTMSRERAAKAHPDYLTNKLNAKKKYEAERTGDAYRQSPEFQHQKAKREMIARWEEEDRLRAARLAKQGKETYQLKSVKKAKTTADKRYNTLWNEAVTQKLNPHDYIEEINKRERMAENEKMAAELNAKYSPEVKAKPAGRRMIVVNGIVEFID